MGDTYTHGHHASVLRSHEWRTVENSAAYLVPRLRPGQRLLDVGCGPGTITVDLARQVAPGSVLGIDASADVIKRAQTSAGTGLEPDDAGSEVEVAFAVGDIYALDHDDASFDVVHAHQVLQHLTDPVAALREMRRVLAPGGTLAVRDADYGAFTWAPGDDRLTRWNELYHQVTAQNGADADAGRSLARWVAAAGFADVEISTGTFDQPDERAWWGALWADRVEQSAFAEQAVAYALSDETELADLAAAWRHWATQPAATFTVPNTQVLAPP